MHVGIVHGCMCMHVLVHVHALITLACTDVHLRWHKNVDSSPITLFIVNIDTSYAFCVYAVCNMYDIMFTCAGASTPLEARGAMHMQHAACKK